MAINIAEDDDVVEGQKRRERSGVVGRKVGRRSRRYVDVGDVKGGAGDVDFDDDVFEERIGDGRGDLGELDGVVDEGDEPAPTAVRPITSDYRVFREFRRSGFVVQPSLLNASDQHVVFVEEMGEFRRRIP